MVMVELIPEKVGPWTFDDVLGLPEDTGWRFEISDGVLEVSPPPVVRHQQLARRLARLLDNDVDRFVLFEVGLDLGPTYRVPDLTVVGDDLENAARRLPADAVLLAVEIVSPTSVTNDRVTKPAQYAARGVRAFWRVETDPTVSITAYVLRDAGDVYTELGTWGEGQRMVVVEPFEIQIAIDDLTRGWR